MPQDPVPGEVWVKVERLADRLKGQGAHLPPDPSLGGPLLADLDLPLPHGEDSLAHSLYGPQQDHAAQGTVGPGYLLGRPVRQFNVDHLLLDGAGTLGVWPVWVAAICFRICISRSMYHRAFSKSCMAFPL